MARYRNSQDLGVFIGARFIAPVLTEGGNPIRGIFIPTDINGIEVQQDTRDEDKRNHSGIRAFINTQQRACNNKYIEAVKQSLMRKGEAVTLHNVPAYHICYTLPEEKRTRIRASLAKRIIAEHPEWASQTDTQGADLARAISMMMPFQMGDSYLIEEPPAASAPRTSSAPVAQGVAGYAPASSPDPFDSAFLSQDEDLPF